MSNTVNMQELIGKLIGERNVRFARIKQYIALLQQEQSYIDHLDEQILNLNQAMQVEQQRELEAQDGKTQQEAAEAAKQQ